MHCPECHSLNEEAAAACSTCGLILLNVPSPEAPKRRSDDQAEQKRRASDRMATVKCQFCSGDLSATAVRCRHCSEIVNEKYYRERARRIRARVNYTSWIAYIFGLGALLVFRPVGLVSIAAGLLLSIAYYAIPVEPPAPRGTKKRSLGAFLRRQLRLERVTVPIPHLRRRRLVFVGTPLIAAMIGYSANVILLQRPMNDVLKQSSAFSGMKVSAHYEYWVVPGVIVYDLRSLTFKQTPLDVHTAFLEFAKRLKAKRFSRIELSYRGTAKFQIDGASFRRLGEEYSKRNFDYVLYSFPRLFRSPDGSQLDDAGGSGRDALLRFHRHWYGEDQLTGSVQNGL